MQISPDGRYWWDGNDWQPLTRTVAPGSSPAGTSQRQSEPPPPSPGLRGFLIVVLLISDLFTGFLALFGLLALADVKGMLGNPPQNLDSGTMVLIAVFELLFVVTFAATAGVFSRAPWARAVTYTAGVALSLTCLGLVLAIPIFIAAARAQLGPAPSPYTLPA